MTDLRGTLKCSYGSSASVDPEADWIQLTGFITSTALLGEAVLQIALVML